MNRYWTAVSAILLSTALSASLGTAIADHHLPSGRISDVRNTKHNLSVTASAVDRDVVAASESEICVFCHTPHGANKQHGPLWNRELSGAAYNTYNSGSLDATEEGIALNEPNGISKLCLSCHDGTIAIGSVKVLNGALASGDIAMTGVEADGSIPGASVEDTGFTRRIGTDLSNDHPISFTFDSALASKDGELRDPAITEHIGDRSVGVSPHVPLENGQVQCNSCHDPHIRDEADPNINIKFLRLNRFQKVSPTSTLFNETTDIICLACHDKAGWVGSAHAEMDVANETYTDEAADLREFPRGTEVWESSCLACHDTHTVAGSRRLLREGTDGSIGPNGERQGGSAAIEETCFACHTAISDTINNPFNEVPDIETDFNMTNHMPIRNSEQAAGVEVHDIGTVDQDVEELQQRGKDFIEAQSALGKVSKGGSLSNRHVECTDCHNPHRVVKRRRFLDDNRGGAVDAAGTHDHDAASHSNIASGVLRGAWGVEPDYSNSNDFNIEPVNYTIKRGDPAQPGHGTGTTAVTEPYVTREYQICLKCHSNYAYDTPPNLNGGVAPTSNSTTLSGTNNMTRYTNQAREFNSPVSHQGEVSNGSNGGANALHSANNHRSWHPVVRETDRNPATRSANANNWLSPFNGDVGDQTMYCSDCHGSAILGDTVDPDGPGEENGAVWGPHGSSNPFILKGDWSGNVPGSPANDFTNRAGTGENSESSTHLCFKCHDYEQYATSGGTIQNSGYGGSSCGMMCSPGTNRANLHKFHVGMVTNFRCNLCHVAVPHGWKNKAFLVNLNDVGPEGGFGSTGNEVRNNTTAGYVNGPYYNRAVLKVVQFQQSGSWFAGACGSKGVNGNGQTGVNWMNGGGGGGGGGGGMGGGGGGGASEACNNVP